LELKVKPPSSSTYWFTRSAVVIRQCRDLHELFGASNEIPKA
jgi:hypothetical protein